MDLTSRLNTAVLGLKPSAILAFNHEISQIDGIIPLTIGEPDFNTPEHVKQAAIDAINKNESHYTASAGLPSLREAASNFLRRKYRLNYDPNNELLVTAGATEAIFSTLTTILNPGDQVIIPTPIFPLYIPIVQLNGGVPVFINTAEDGFVLTPKRLKEALDEGGDKVKAVILNFPTNPTGVTYSREQLEGLSSVLDGRDIFVVSDEIYSELTYGEAHTSMGEVLPDQTIVLNGVSKSHAMTGWRIGLIGGPAAIVQEIGKVHQFAITSATTNAQYAALEALLNGADDAFEMREAYSERREVLLAGLKAAGFEVAKPDGAFYLFAKLPKKFGSDSWDFAYALAREAKVAVIPGESFGPGGEGYVRLSYATSLEAITAAVSRIQEFVQNH